MSLPCRGLNSTTGVNVDSERPPGPIQRLYILHRNNAGMSAPQNYSPACSWPGPARAPPSKRPYLRPKMKQKKREDDDVLNVWMKWKFRLRKMDDGKRFFFI